MEVLKQLRHRQIRDIVERQPIRTQHELAAALRERGFRVTQATVSRDIGELGLIKVTREGGNAYELPDGAIDSDASPDQRLRDLLNGLPIEVRPAGLLLVIRALPGSAHAIAAALDRCRWPEVAGSLAGDDTLFVAFSDTAGQRRVTERLEAMVGD
jgi:transcriptional regulator of arginine metabolism